MFTLEKLMYYNDVFQTSKLLTFLITLEKPFRSQQFVLFLTLKCDNLSNSFIQ